MSTKFLKHTEFGKLIVTVESLGRVKFETLKDEVLCFTGIQTEGSAYLVRDVKNNGDQKLENFNFFVSPNDAKPVGSYVKQQITRLLIDLKDEVIRELVEADTLPDAQVGVHLSKNDLIIRSFSTSLSKIMSVSVLCSNDEIYVYQPGKPGSKIITFVWVCNYDSIPDVKDIFHYLGR